MLRYLEFGLSHKEVPNEVSLCIYISGCTNNCEDCHYPELRSPDSGLLLSEYFDDMINLYQKQMTCVCFMGEGDCSETSKNELKKLQAQCQSKGYKTCLYCGRDTYIEDWMIGFDYIKSGSYVKELGALESRFTNQKMFKKQANGAFIDITYCFWQDKGCDNYEKSFDRKNTF